VRLTPADRTNGLLLRFEPLKARPNRLQQSAVPVSLFGSERRRRRLQVAVRTWAEVFAARARVGPSGRACTPGGEGLADQNVRRGRRCREALSTCQEGKPLKGEPHERYRHETRPEGFREEQDVKGLGKPEGVAQPGEVSPVLVASRYSMRCRGDRPHERRPRERRSGSGQTLELDEVHERIQAGSSRSCLPGTRGKTP
jgi:hypothetical protein